jgi:putative membrane protein
VSYVTHHWTYDPMLVIVGLTVVAHEVGLARLRTHSATARTKRRRRRSLLFYGGLAVLLLAIASPIDYWSSRYFFVHMLEHLLMVFFAPMLIVAGAPWIPLMFALSVGPRRSVGRFFYLSSSAGALRVVGRFIRDPWVAAVSFNATMLLWHIPSWFDLAERNSFVHIWLMHGSMIATGMLFWLQIIPSYPMKPSRGPVFQVGAIVASNLIMTILAISMSILTAVSWYPVYAHLPGVTLSPFADQQIGAAILWVCGDFWALPAVYLIIRRAIESEGSLGTIVDKMMGRGAAPSIEAFRRSFANGESEASPEVAAE